nr:DUF2812 domain-containing protein [uncultured Oscillibacter sp.]
MKDVRYRWNTLCIYDRRGVEEHLTAMAAKGWRLEKTGNTLWKYRRAEPAEVRYAVTYSAGASQFEPGPTEGQQSLEELCAAAGWTKVCDWCQMQIFSTEDPAAVPLETDEAIRLENLHRSMRKNFLPANFILLAVGLFMSASFLGTLSVKPLQILQRNASLFSGPLFVLVAALEICTLCHYYGWRRRSLRSIAGGGPCAPISTRAYQRLNAAGLVLVGIFLALYLAMELAGGGGRGHALFLVLYLALFALVVALIRGTTALLRRRGVSKWWNIAGTLAADVVLVSVMIGGLAWGAIRFDWSGSGSGETYTYHHLEFDVHPREDVPLTLTDLTGETYRHTSREWRSEGSFFVPKQSYREYALQDTEGASKDVWPGSLHLSYTICEPRGRWLYDALVEDLLNIEDRKEIPEFQRIYREEDPAPWGAEAAYQQYYRQDGDAADDWLLCWPGRVVLLSLDRPLTDAEKAVIRERLSAGA